MRERLGVDRYTKTVLTLIVVLLAALLCKPLFVAEPAFARGYGLRLPERSIVELKEKAVSDVYYLGLTDEELLTALQWELKELFELQEKNSKLTPDEKKEIEDEELKKIAEMSREELKKYTELRGVNKFAQINLILELLYDKGYRVKFVTDTFIILEK